MKVIFHFVSFVVLTLTACQREARVDSDPFQRQTADKVQNTEEKLKELRLNKIQSRAAEKGAVMEVAKADFGYSTADINLVIAEISQGSGVAYVSWVVIRKGPGNSWRIQGKPSNIVVRDPRSTFRITKEKGLKFFEVTQPATGEIIRLPL